MQSWLRLVTVTTRLRGPLTGSLDTLELAFLIGGLVHKAIQFRLCATHESGSDKTGLSCDVLCQPMKGAVL